MSAPIEHGDKVDDAMVYAPPWARNKSRLPQQSAASSDTAYIPSPPVAPPPDGMPPGKLPRLPLGVGGPNIAWAPRLLPSKPFEGDLQMIELRRRLSLQPDIVPHPPGLPRRSAAMSWVARLAPPFVISAGLAVAVTVVSSQDGQQSPRPVDKEVVRASQPQILLAQTGGDRAVEERVRLIVQGRTAFANEPLPLQIALNGGSGEEFMLLTNLVAGTRLSTGLPHGPSSWRVAASDTGSLFAYAPKDYVGTMNVGVDLRSGNQLVDHQVVRLEWVEKPAVELAATQAESDPRIRPRAPEIKLDLSHDEISTLVQRGQQLMNIGDISSARLMLQRAAKAGNPQAALLLGATFDPFVLKDLGVIGFASDATQARDWYRKAAELGSPEASSRIERLALTGR